MQTLPASHAAVTSERLFSRAGDIISNERNQLAPSESDCVVFLMDNLELAFICVAPMKTDRNVYSVA